jgi:hypothetical protein
MTLLDFIKRNLLRCCVDSPSTSIFSIINRNMNEEPAGHIKQYFLGNNQFVYFIVIGMVVQSVIRLTMN